MKRTIIVSLSFLVFLAGCVMVEPQIHRVEEGIPVEVGIGFSTGASPVYTRSAQSSGNEFYVENLYILVFDNNDNGKRLMTTNSLGDTLAFFTMTEGLTVTQGNEDSPTHGSISFTVPSAESATVIAIANVGLPATRYSVTANQLDRISSLSELQSKVVETDATVSRGNRFLMTGSSSNIIIENGSSSTGELCNIELKRLDAKIEVSITSEVPADKKDDWKGMSFSPRTWKIVNVPGQSRLLPYAKNGVAGPWEDTDQNTMSGWDAQTGPDGADALYYTTGEYEFETESTYEDDNTVYYRGGGFIFYMPENRKRYKESAGSYADRDKFQDNTSVYANDNSTYMVLTGYLSYTDIKTGQVVNADTRYIVHLGYLSGNCNDYDTKQNGHYKYNLKVMGIDNIETEVNSGGSNEVRPGYEGDVVYSTEAFELDAHYETRLFRISKNMNFDNMTWSVWTPFSSGTYSGGTDYTGIKDYRWIKFAFNAHFDTPKNEFVKFPGTETEGDDPYDASRNVEQLDERVSDGKPTLFDIDQLIKYLQYKKDAVTLLSSADDSISITAFVDEYMYLSNPEDNKADDLLFWKQCVDTDDRLLHILKDDRNTSSDGNSSITEALYTFRQKSIRTVYNKDARDDILKTAWGLETTIEKAEADSPQPGNRLKPGDDAIRGIGSLSDNRNGRKNTVNIVGERRWSDIINDKNNTLNEGYKYAAYACMLRNRDENGDGEIQENEIKWYLAAIDQLTDIYVGEWALNTASRLYPDYRPGGIGPYWHYTSSSYNGTENGPWVLWAEEGASRGSYNNDGGNDSQSLNGEYYSYRCVRNLGIDVNDIETNPDELIEFKNTGNDPLGPYTFDLSRINPKSLRELPVSGKQSEHTHTQDINRPYCEGFVVDPGTWPEPEALDWNSQYWGYYQTNNPCPDGYRVPNQRELLIMSTRLPESAWQSYIYMSYTAFDLNDTDYYEHRDGFMYNAEANVFMLQNWHEGIFSWNSHPVESGYVRCIKDNSN